MSPLSDLSAAFLSRALVQKMGINFQNFFFFEDNFKDQAKFRLWFYFII